MQSGMVRSLLTSSLERIRVMRCSRSWGDEGYGAMRVMRNSCRALARRSAVSWPMAKGRLAHHNVREPNRKPEMQVAQESDPFKFFPYQAIVDRPPITWPNGARVAVWVIPNIEHFHIEIGSNAPDIRNHSRRDYGNRVGVWRVMETLAKHNVRGTVALNAEV